MSKVASLSFKYDSDFYQVTKSNCTNPNNNKYAKYINLIHKDLLKEKTIKTFDIKKDNFIIAKLRKDKYIKDSIELLPFKVTKSHFKICNELIIFLMTYKIKINYLRVLKVSSHLDFKKSLSAYRIIESVKKSSILGSI